MTFSTRRLDCRTEGCCKRRAAMSSDDTLARMKTLGFPPALSLMDMRVCDACWQALQKTYRKNLVDLLNLKESF